MKITIIGVGGVGGYFGGRLAQKHDVTFIARGDTLRALNEKGLTVDSVEGDFHLNVKATDTYEPTDLIIICTKAPQLREVVDLMKPAVTEKTLILPLLNGVDAVYYLREQFGKQVIGGFCRVISFKVGPAHIKNPGGKGSVDIGEVDGPVTPRVRKIEQLFNDVNVPITANDDFLVAQWKKMVLICSISAVGAVTKATFGPLRTIPETREMMINSMREVITVARHLEVDIEYSYAEELMSFVDTLPETGTASMQRDIMEGKPSELHFLIGNVVKLGKELDIPLSRYLYHSLLPQENMARGM